MSLYLDLAGLPTGPVPDAVRRQSRARAVVMDLGERSRDLLGTVRGSGVPVWSGRTSPPTTTGSTAFHAPVLEAASYVFHERSG